MIEIKINSADTGFLVTVSRTSKKNEVHAFTTKENLINWLRRVGLKRMDAQEQEAADAQA